MARKSSLTELQKIEIAEWVKTNSTQHGRGAVKRAADHFGLTPAVIKSALPKVEKPEGEKPKAVKPKKARKAKTSPNKTKETEKISIAEFMKERMEEHNLLEKIRELLK